MKKKKKKRDESPYLGLTVCAQGSGLGCCGGDTQMDQQNPAHGGGHRLARLLATSFSANRAGTAGRRQNLNLKFTLHAKINSKWVMG